MPGNEKLEAGQKAHYSPPGFGMNNADKDGFLVNKTHTSENSS